MVYKAEQLNLDRQVAIKFIDARWQANDETWARLQREALILGELQHKNIVSLYGCSLFNDTPYVVMELATGRSLAHSMMMEREKFSLPRIINIAEQICLALQHAHGHGIIHRDLKPGNIMLTSTEAAPQGELVRVIDFGLAKLMPDFTKDFQKLTKTGATVGSVLYMSPEQCKGTVEQRSDIYALGVILYECVSGTPPFVAPHDFAVMYAHLQEEAKPLTIRDGDDPKQFALFEGIILKALSKDPADRYQTAGEMLDDLAALKTGQSENLAATIELLANNVPQKKSKVTLYYVSIAALFALMVLVSVLAIYQFKQAKPAVAAGDPDTHEVAADIYWRWIKERDNAHAAYVLISKTPANRAKDLQRLLDLNDKDHTLDGTQVTDMRGELITAYFLSDQLKAGWKFMQSAPIQEYKRADPQFYSLWLAYAGSVAKTDLTAGHESARNNMDVVLGIRDEIRSELACIRGRSPQSINAVLDGLTLDLVGIDTCLTANMHANLDTDCQLLAKFPVETYGQIRASWLTLGNTYASTLRDSKEAAKCFDAAAYHLDADTDEQRRKTIRKRLAIAYKDSHHIEEAERQQ